jgi:TPR repeat protein
MTSIKQEIIKKAKELFSKACDAKDAEGCFNLGNMYDNGEGVKRNYSKSKAVSLYKRACDDKYIQSCYTPGFMYENGDMFGQGVKQNYSKVAKFYKKACDGKDALGCSELGVMYNNRQGIRQNQSKAKRTFW